MLTYNLENRGKRSLYEYIYECVRRDIQNDILKTDEKLPSKRELAENLGVSVITVQNAYEQLLLEGYIYSVEKKGYFVSELQKEAGRMEVLEEQVRKPGERKKYLVDFSSNYAAASQFPSATWAKIMRKTLLDYEKELMQSPPHTGVSELKIAIANHLKSYRNLDVNSDQIIVGAGTEYLYSLLVLLMGHNRIIAVEDPGHTKIARVYESNGIKVIHIPVDKKGLCVEKLDGSNAACVHISPSHHYPTGIVMPAQRRHQLVAWAKKHNSYIIEDDYDSEFRFMGRPLTALASIAPERVIYMNTFSKTLVPSIRIAYMILPKELMEIYRKKLGFYSNTVSGIDQYNLASFISEGYFERHINRMRNYYRKHRDTLIQTLRNSPLYEVVTIEEENAGLHFLLGIRQNIDDEVFVTKLEEKGIHLNAVSSYCHSNPEDFRHKFIINYSDVSEGHLSEAFHIMHQVLLELKAQVSLQQ